MPVITPDESGSNRFRAMSVPDKNYFKSDKPKRASRAVCKDCNWEYDPPEGCNQLVVFSHAAGHSYRGNHEIRFEDVAVMAPGDFVTVYQKPLTDEDVEGVAALVKFVGSYEGEHERWIVRFRHEHHCYERVVHPRNLTGGRSLGLVEGGR